MTEVNEPARRKAHFGAQHHAMKFAAISAASGFIVSDGDTVTLKEPARDKRTIPAKQIASRQFHRLGPSRGQGEGLGLTIAQRILERQNGKIWVESASAKGTTSFVSLPAK